MSTLSIDERHKDESFKKIYLCPSSLNSVEFYWILMRVKYFLKLWRKSTDL